MPIRSGSPEISGASVRPSALVTVSRSSARALAPISCSSILHAGDRAAGGGVEHVGREPAGGIRLARAVHLGREPQPGDQPDLGERRCALRIDIVAEAALELRQDRVLVCRRTQTMKGKPNFSR